MRLHRLEVTAFGPFADHQVVDFDRLSTAGLFLLHGPTGAGKTSVLDAVCFALYGRVPGPRAGTGRLRSDHAPAEVPPSVVCEFTVGGRRLEVTRTPEWDRPKKRGTGSVKQHTTVLVREFREGAWTALAQGVQEASDLLGDLLGLDVDQFTKLILLPQGDFAAFLRAGEKERRPMLQKLFGTDRFADVERWLAEKRRELDHSMQATRLTTSVLFARALEARLPGGPQVPDEVAASPEAALAEVRRWAEQATAERGRAHAAVTAAEDEYEAARRATAEAEAALAERERRAHLAQLLEHLEGQARAQAARREAARAADAATVLAPLLRSLGEARAAHARAVAALASADVPASASTAEVVRARAEATRAEITALAALLEAEADLRRLDERHRAAEESIEAAGRRRQAAVEALDELTTQRSELGEHRAAAELVAVTVADAEREAGRADALAAAVERLASLERRLVAAHDRRRAAVDVHQAAVATTQELRARRLDGMAAELASSLGDGDPCPVCGSADHPAPAEPGATRVTPAEQDAAEAREAAAAQSRDGAQQAVAELERERAAVLAVTGGATPEEAAAARAAARERLAGARAARERVADLTIRVAALTDRIEKAEQARAQADQQTAAAREALAELGGRREELRARLEAARGDDPDLRSRSARLTREAAADTAWLAAVEAVAEAADHLARSTTDAGRAALAAGFATLDEATAAALPESGRRALLVAVKEHDDELARVRGLLAELDHENVEAERAEVARLQAEEEAAADGQLSFDFSAGPEPVRRAGPDDLDELRARQAAARDRHEAARDRHTLAARAAHALTGLADDLARHAEATAPLRERFAVVESVSRCLEGGGENLLRMRLSSYVLAARLEQVAEAASARLTAMSGGRFQLVHTDGLARAGAKSGLGLAVVDGWTGVQRDPATLSGGETFCTSLALALGLADVVQAEAGGASIETLLVDEGFGTLDEQTLDEVMDVLDGLRSAGRAVGLVSHVADLRDRIPARLEVVKTRTGSRLINDQLIA
jgi:DNA repair protein SbcC/Rad50